MKGKLEEQITRTLLPGMHMPEAISALFEWIEQNNLYIDRPTGERIGFLFPDSELKESWSDDSRDGGTIIEFAAEGNVNLKYWFGHEDPEVLSRLCVFAKTGAEGSMAAFWLDPHGNQKIVHLGSGSGSVTVCVLAENPVDFLRLLAIGYDEICWGQELAAPPVADGDFFVRPNGAFQDWVRSRFATTIPTTGMEIVPHPDDMHSPTSEDPFNRWVARHTS